MRQFTFLLLIGLYCESPAQQPGKAWDLFFDKFFSDSSFQINHIRFPLQKVVRNMQTEDNDTTQVEKSKWTFQDFGFFKNNFNVQVYDNFKRELRATTERCVSFYGVENGLSVSLYFEFLNKEWILVQIVDLST